jgi:hypothetical protein
MDLKASRRGFGELSKTLHASGAIQDGDMGVRIDESSEGRSIASLSRTMCDTYCLDSLKNVRYKHDTDIAFNNSNN